MSTPVTPTAARKKTFPQGPSSGDNNEGGSGWWGAIGGVVGEFLQGWGLFGVLRKRSGAPGGVRSTPATPPMYSHPSSPSHEHIELRQLSFQCREDGDGSDAGLSSVLTSCVGVQRRHPRNHSQSRRAPRHSYYEGSTPDSYLLTAVLIHSLKHGSGKACQEPHCQICTPNRESNCDESQSETEPLLSTDVENIDLQISIPEQRYSRSVSQEGSELKNWKVSEKDYLNLSSNSQRMSQISPLSSPSNSFQYAQISPLSSPHSSIAPSSALTSLNPSSSVTYSDSSVPLLESELSSLDISSLTDVTMSSSLLSGSALSLHQADCLLGLESNLTSSELSLATTADCGTLIGSFSSETNMSDTVSSETFQCESFPKHLTIDTMSSSVHSLPSRLTLKDRASPSLLRPVLLSTGSLVLLPRRPSLVSPPVSSASSQGHFMWEENPCYVRVEGSRPGEGHVFRSTTLERPAWCDACAHLVFYHATTCHNCSYTCHEQCQDLVTLDCKADLTPDSHTSEEDLYEDTTQGTLVRHENLSNQNLSITVTSQDDESLDEDDCHEEQEEKHEEEQQEKELLEEPFRKHEEVSTLRKSVNRLQSHLVDNETLEAWVEKYNATTQGLQIAKENDGSYRGCIRVHLNLSRPINIVAGTRPPSIYDILQEDRTMEKTLTSFYMPRDAVKAIHITSKTTTREVIIALLRKFKVVDNPQKFALYERTYDTGQPGKAKLRRLGDSECPLVLAINWSAQGLTNKRLVLQENDTADIQWEAFSLPELSNFLRILDREEEEYRCQIKDKYALLRRRIGNMLIQNPPSAE